MTLERELSQAEKRNRRKLKAALLLLLVGIKSPIALVAAAPTIARKLSKTISSLHREPVQIANRESEPVTDQVSKESTVDPLLVGAAAMGVVTNLMARVSLAEEGTAFRDALSGAVEATEARLVRIAATSTFSAFNKQLRANLEEEQGEWIWSATLDKKTCPQCASLDGRRWSKESDVPAIPAHANCRCALKFEPF